MKPAFQVLEPEAVFGAMPDTVGLNYFLTDPNLGLLLEMYVNESDLERAWPHLTKLGEIAGTELDQYARIADKNPPQLVSYNARGERVDQVVFHPAYHEMEKIGYSQFGLVAMTHREGILGWPSKFSHVLKYAFWYLFAQAEFGLCCPMSMTDTAATVLERFGSEELKQTYLPRMLSTDMNERWTGGQFMTEKQGVPMSEPTRSLLYTAHVYDQVEKEGGRHQTLLRTLTPLLKGYICKRARYTTAEGMEVRGVSKWLERLMDWEPIPAEAVHELLPHLQN